MSNENDIAGLIPFQVTVEPRRKQLIIAVR